MKNSWDGGERDQEGGYRVLEVTFITGVVRAVFETISSPLYRLLSPPLFVPLFFTIVSAHRSAIHPRRKPTTFRVSTWINFRKRKPSSVNCDHAMQS